MTPVILDEQLVHRFNFYFEGNIRQGMRHGCRLYGLVEQFNSRHRLNAYQLACELAEQGLPIVVTVSGSSYRVWLGLDSPSYPHFHARQQVAWQPLLVA
ncbi:hypothetical protein [Leptolyngbya sp. 'hensonii']|uniref:hypothetical protein n=1 Tax=Leptolyngbya sp. 'hensonii' TaxID=1922337 RepID=UPI00094FF816|nr:hypothetical protein [Leptolyngbya sp. 'hensonii']